MLQVNGHYKFPYFHYWRFTLFVLFLSVNFASKISFGGFLKSEAKTNHPFRICFLFCLLRIYMFNTNSQMLDV